MAKFTCPGCGTHYRLPEGSAGKRVRCKKCGEVSRIPEADDDGPIRIAGEPEDFFAEAAAAASHAGPAATADSPGVAYAHADSASHAVAEADALVAAGRISDTRPAGRTFWSDVGWSFLFIAQPANAISFAVIWLILAVGSVIPFVSFLVVGWYAAFRFAVIESCAAGEEELPSVGLSGGFVESFIYPAFKWAGSWIVIMLPALVYQLVRGATGSQGPGLLTILFGGLEGLTSGSYDDPVLICLVAGGLFLWPMIVLCIALGGFATLHRLDLILRTIGKTFSAYLVTAAVVFGVEILGQVLSTALAGAMGAGAVGPGAQPSLRTLLGKLAVWYVLVTGIALYLEIISLRLIGLYYLHLKHRFAWEWE